MTRTYIDLPLCNGDPFWPLVAKAEIVDVAPHLTTSTWAVHLLPIRERWWRVSNIETGECAAPIGRTRTEAITKARAYLADKTNRQVAKGYRRWLRRGLQ